MHVHVHSVLSGDRVQSRHRVLQTGSVLSVHGVVFAFLPVHSAAAAETFRLDQGSAGDIPTARLQSLDAGFRMHAVLRFDT